MNNNTFFKTINLAQILDKGKTAVRSTQQREKSRTGTKSSFEFIYENILGNWVDCYPKSAFEYKIALATIVKRLTVEKKKDGVGDAHWSKKLGAKTGVLYLGCISVCIYRR